MPFIAWGYFFSCMRTSGARMLTRFRTLLLNCTFHAPRSYAEWVGTGRKAVSESGPACRRQLCLCSPTDHSALPGQHWMVAAERRVRSEGCQTRRISHGSRTRMLFYVYPHKRMTTSKPSYTENVHFCIWRGAVIEGSFLTGSIMQVQTVGQRYWNDLLGADAFDCVMPTPQCQMPFYSALS